VEGITGSKTAGCGRLDLGRLLNNWILGAWQCRRQCIVGQKRDGAATSIDFREGLVEYAGVMLGQPVPKHHARDADLKLSPTVGDERGGLEPHVETVPVDLGFDAGQTLVPDVADHRPRACWNC